MKLLQLEEEVISEQNIKKVTIKDVAREAKVSIATVSYIINGKNLNRISEATIKRVNQWINIFGYHPSETARNLQNSRTNCFAFVSSKKLTYLQKIELMNFLEPFSLYANMEKYRILYTYQANPETIRNCDAIVCYNMPKEEFYALGDVNTIPMIAVDTILNDWLFYQITKDYETIKDKAMEHYHDDFTLLTISPKSKETQEEIERIFSDVVFVDKLEDIVSVIEANRKKNILIFDSSINTIFEALYPKANVYYCSYRTQEIFCKILECVKWAMDRVDGKEHSIKI